jgi:hypothetical protein
LIGVFLWISDGNLVVPVLAFERHLTHLYVGLEEHVDNGIGAAAKNRVSDAQGLMAASPLAMFQTRHSAQEQII